MTERLSCFGEKRFGFGMMRLPMIEKDGQKQVDTEQVCRMTDLFLTAGFRYFDTAHGYLHGMSEKAVRDCVATRYPRSSFLLTNKLSAPFFKSREDIRPLFDRQLKACGVDYFDLYLMHSLVKENYPHFKACRAFETALRLKEEGLIRHLGFSFHDSPEMLDEILTEYPETETVQIQLNYLDAEDEQVQGMKAYEVCRKHGKPVIVMEPVKGGRLVDLPANAAELLDAKGQSRAGFALRYAAGFDNVSMILSGMSDLSQMKDNIRTMAYPRPLDEEEQETLHQVTAILRGEGTIACTDCEYCLSECPKHIPIPTIFGYMNERLRDESAVPPALDTTQGNPEDCIACRKCEKVCPQHLPIPLLMKRAQSASI